NFSLSAPTSPIRSRESSRSISSRELGSFSSLACSASAMSVTLGSIRLPLASRSRAILEPTSDCAINLSVSACSRSAWMRPPSCDCCASRNLERLTASLSGSSLVGSLMLPPLCKRRQRLKERIDVQFDDTFHVGIHVERVCRFPARNRQLGKLCQEPSGK